MGVPRAGRLILALGLSSVLAALALAGRASDGPASNARPAARPAISELSAASRDGVLLVSFRLDRALDKRTWEKIESGLPTGFTYDIQVRRIRRRWFDKAVVATRLQVVAMYNALTREYQVNFRRDGELYASRVVTSQEELERALTTFEGLPSVALADEPPGRLVLRVRAEVGTRTRLGLIPDRVHTAWAQTTPFRHAQRQIGSGEGE